MIDGDSEVEPTTSTQSEPARPWSPGQPAQIDTPGYRLRTLTKADATERFVAWMEDAEVQRFLNSPPMATSQQALGMHIEAFDNRTAFLFGVFDRSAADLHIGFYPVYCDLLNGSAETLVTIGDRSYWGKKVVAATRPALIDFLFDRVGLEKVWGRPLARDFAGIHNFIALGFQCEGILRSQLRAPDGARLDQFFYGLQRKEWRARRRAAKR